MKKVVITGGAGFIGANLARHMASTDDIGEVVAFDNLSTGFESNLDGIDATFIEADFLDTAALSAAVAGATAIVHLGARPSVPRSIKDPIASHNANATGTINVLEAARAEGCQVIVASSSSVYGSNPTMPKHEDLATRPLSPYAASKLATEAYCLAYGSSYGMNTIAFRFFNVFGPLQAAGHAYAAVVPAFVSAALNGEPVTIHGDGLQSRDFTFVDTVASVITSAVLRDLGSPEPMNLAFGTRTNLLEVVDLLEEILDHPIERTHIDTRAGDVKHSQAANDRLQKLFGDVEPVDLRTGLERTVKWFQSTANQ